MTFDFMVQYKIKTWPLLPPPGPSLSLRMVTAFCRALSCLGATNMRPPALDCLLTPTGTQLRSAFWSAASRLTALAIDFTRLRGNDQFFTRPGEIHDTAGLPQERGILYWLILRLDKTKPLIGLSQSQSQRLRQELLHLPERHFRGHSNCSEILAETLSLMVERYASRKKIRSGLLELRLQSLLLQYLTLTAEASHRGVKGSASLLIQRVLHFIERNVNEPIHVPKLAEVARLSESRLKMRFKREIGVPPAEFWLRQKIEKAVILLKSKTVTEVAHELGFSSSQYFATVFKRYTLASPSRFRERN